MNLYIILLLSVFCLFFQLYLLLKKIKVLTKIKMRPHDKKVNVIIEAFYPSIHGGILQCCNDGIEQKCILYFNYYSGKYSVGKEVILNISKESGLVYDKIDLIMSFLLELFSTLCFLFIVIALLLHVSVAIFLALVCIVISIVIYVLFHNR